MSQASKKFEDLAVLEKELKDSIEADKLYWLRNNAKINAVTTTKTYNEFRNVVEAAHLTPISKEDKMKVAKINWNKSYR